MQIRMGQHMLACIVYTTLVQADTDGKSKTCPPRTCLKRAQNFALGNDHLTLGSHHARLLAAACAVSMRVGHGRHGARAVDRM